jgi:hypothetical protein
MPVSLRRFLGALAGNRRAATLCAIAYLAFFSVYLSERPVYDWDVLAYMAVALRIEGVPAARIHDETYDLLRSSIPHAWVDNLSGNFNPEAIAVDPSPQWMGDIGLRQDWAAHSDSFAAQLPFFSVKPLYPALMALGNSIGLSLIESGLIVSAISYFLIGVIFYAWFLERMPPFVALGAMALLILNPWLVPLARVIGPDILSIAFVLGGAYFAIKGRPVTSAIIFVLSITARPENVLYAGIFLCYLGIVQSLSLLWTGVFLVLALAVYKGISTIGNNYGWKTLFYYVFVNRSARPGVAAPPIGIHSLLAAYLGRLDRIIFGGGESPVFALVGFGVLCLKLGVDSLTESIKDKYTQLVLVATVAAIARMILLPTEAYRGLLPSYMLVTVAFLNVCASACTQLRAAKRAVPP